MWRRVAVMLPLFIMLVWWTTGIVGASQTFELEIPSIDLKSSIINLPLTRQADGSMNWNTDRLYMKAGYLQGTAWFGQGGNVVLGGHSERQDEPDVFYNLNLVTVGAEIVVQLGSETLRYEVTEIRLVEMSDVSVLYSSGHEQLTLITCDKDSQQPNGVYTNRVVVIATPVS